MHHGILLDIGLAIVAATALAYVARLLRQPLLLAYIGAGLLIGPPVLGLVHSEEAIAELSELGLAFLMFIVGLEIDLKKLVSSGRIGALVGTMQVVACAVLTVGFVMLLGFGGLSALYLGVATAFSSTMIVVKLLSDKSELDTVDGRLTLGILLMQDVLAIVVLAIQPNLDDPSVVPIVDLGALRLRAGGRRAAGLAVRAAGAVPVRRQEPGDRDDLGDLLVPGRRLHGDAGRLLDRDGRADRRRDALGVPVQPGRRRQDPQPARLLRHPLLRRAGHAAPDRLAPGGAASRWRSRRSSSSAGSSRSARRSTCWGTALGSARSARSRWPRPASSRW